jgi:hypothetical protein
MGIKKETLEFIENAKQYFESEEGKIVGSTYQDDKLGYIGLRWGLLDNCIKVYELGDEVGFFEDWVDRVPYQEQIDYYIRRIEYNDLYITPEQIGKLQNIINRKTKLK